MAAITVHDVLKSHGPNVVCPASATLTDAADVMMEGGRTSALVKDANDAPIGVITANDLLAAFVEGVGWEASVAKWLRAGDARLPGELLPALSVASTASLEDAANLMASQKGTDHASHHVAVKDGNDNIIGVLSALDLAKAISKNSGSAITQRLADHSVEKVMKARAALPECAAANTLAQAFREMFAARQNCVVIVEEIEGGGPDSKRVEGVITPRDVLRAFAEHVPGTTTVVGWLRGVQSNIESRTVNKQAKLSEAADLMAAHTVHHVLALDPPSSDVQGILSALDVVCAIAQAKGKSQSN
mmetsp:Transcript_40243/g.92526  ORF Transcript_40243/g.92526 Transcript_40243/m.92526 type:complete len:302 (-) Transcript_40243:13-918(-)